MKLVTEFYDLPEAEKISNRMRRAGVMTVVTSKRSYKLSRVKTGALKVGLWVVLDEQYQDAVQLLENHDHKPKRVIPLSEMDEIQNLARLHFGSGMKKLIEKSAALFFGGILLALVIFVVIGLIIDA